jgi:lipopolysaccharide/colanic/teichoic acid biosynthesis glycosyltransferase
MSSARGLSTRQRAVKRAFDLVVAGVGLVATAPVIAVAWVLATIDTRQNGMFRQLRVGRHGELFQVLKIRTMRGRGGSTVTTAGDVRLTRLGALLRTLKIDELPQLVNVVRGEMSLVGPRPDVPGFADELTGPDRVLLTVRPGITGPAAVAYRHEEALLATVEDPEAYSRDVLWPAKVALNREYVESWTLRADVHWIIATVRSVLHRRPVGGSVP